MTRVQLVADLQKFCREAVKNMTLPVAVQKGDTKMQARAPEVYQMRVPHSDSAHKYVPYIIVQFIDSQHVQNEEKQPLYTAEVRFIFAVYSEDEQEGAIMLLNVMDRVQEKLLKTVQIGSYSLLNVHQPLEALVYPDYTPPYYAGEMVGTFILPPIGREVLTNGQKERYRFS